MRPHAPTPRSLQREARSYDLVVIGGGMAGIAAAVTAARKGVRTALVQDRPVLGGNASTEIRVNLEGANGGGHNRFFVESGLAEDLLLENLWRNPTGSADHWGSILLDLVLREKELTLYLDTVVQHVAVREGSIESVDAFTLGAERQWRLNGRYFVDATGDGTVAYLAGAEFMYGEEARHVFEEPLSPVEGSDITLGGTMWFMCKDVGRRVDFIPPDFARRVSEDELRLNRGVNVWQQAPILGGFWWVEYGGELDTIADNPEIKRVLLSEVYGLWDYVKNHPKHKERNATLDLEWVASMPGKRESRRIVGDYVITEHDVIESRRFDDGVAFGGWSIDRHPPGGFFDVDKPPCVQVHPPGLYQIPLRSLYARDVPNLFLAGRDISYSHVACCSARVMLTCTHIGEAVGMAAALAMSTGHSPRKISSSEPLLAQLHRNLERSGHHVPYRKLSVDRIPETALVRTSSDGPLAHDAITTTVDASAPRMLSLPLTAGCLETVALWVEAEGEATLEWRLYASDSDGRWIPGELLAEGATTLHESSAGGSWVDVEVGAKGRKPGYVHFAFAADRPAVRVGASEERPLGPLTWKSVSGSLDGDLSDQRATRGWELDQHSEAWGDSAAYPFSNWRRDGHGWGGPPGPALAFRATPAQLLSAGPAVLEPHERPTVDGVHAWVSGRCEGEVRHGQYVFFDPQWIEVQLVSPTVVEAIEVYLNADSDRHLANIWYAHEAGIRAMSPLVADFQLDVKDPLGHWLEVERLTGNYRRRHLLKVGRSITAWRLTCFSTHGEPYASVVDFRMHVPPDAGRMDE